jgi:hypothetical protein
MSKAKARVFVPLTKVDEEQRLVYGRITQEMLDKSGEVMDYETSKPYFEKWSADIEAASGGLSKGNVRVMHGLTAAGKLTELEFDDTDKAIDVCAKIVDDQEWAKVQEGVYTGFSVGGKYAKRWTAVNDNGEKVKKFTADPNEVSIVDNPCVPNACFSMFKADGTEVAVAFQVENDDEAWPGFAKSDNDQSDPGDEDPAAEAPKTPDPKPAEEPAEPTPATTTPVEKAIASVANEPTSEQVAAKAEELAKAANDGSTWMNHIETARAELLKGDSPLSLAAEQEREKKEHEQGTGQEASEEDATAADEGADDEEAGDDDATSEKITPAGVCQKWTTSDGQMFDKKADAVAHEEALTKAAEPQTEAQKLAARLAKATNPDEPVEETPLIEDFDRLAKAVQAISTPFDDAGQPKLEKGMYTVNRFSNVLSDMASLSRSIKAEGKREGDDGEDASISAELIASVKTLGATFLDYAKDQVTELLAGMDDDVVVSYHDYYYAAAKEDGDNQLAKDVVGLLTEYRDPSRERRDTLAKAFGYVEGELEVTEDDVLSPPMQKRFDALEAENTELKKVAEDAVLKVEELAKRVQAVEDTPMPRAPKNVALRPGDGTFFGKTANTEEEKLAVVHDMLKTKGPDAVALELIKLSQGNPIHLNLKG